MRLGLFSMPLHPPERPIADAYDDDIAMLELADHIGYHEAWIGEHFTSAWENIPAPDLFIARAAARTTRLLFGTGVVLMPFHNPLFVALRLAQLDHQTRGRLMVGVGSGGIQADRRAFGVEVAPEQAGKLTWEGVELIQRYWAGEPVQFQGEFFRADIPAAESDIQCGVLMRPYQAPHPPIALAGVTRASYGLGIAGERGWLPLSTNFLPATALASHWDSYAAGAARAGKSPDRAVWRIARDVHVAETDELAVEQARNGGMARAYRDYMLRLVGSGPRGLAAFKSDPDSTPDSVVDVDYLLEHNWIVGSPERVAHRLRALYEQVGGFGVLLQVAFDWAPEQNVWRRSMELLAGEVMPRLADLEA